MSKDLQEGSRSGSEWIAGKRAVGQRDHVKDVGLSRPFNWESHCTILCRGVTHVSKDPSGC